MGQTLWRLHLRPEEIDPADAVSYCIAHGFIGLGWKGPEEVEGESVAAYLARHTELYGRKERSVHRILAEVKKGDLIWSRDAQGGFLLAEVSGAPFMRFGALKELRDMFHVAPAEIIGGRNGTHPIQDTEVPGAVKSRFSRRGSALERMHDRHVREYSAWLFATKMGRTAAAPDPVPFIDALDPYELEDLVGLYLQEHGWRIIMSSHTATTPRYEATFVHPDHGTAGVQVKHKGTALDAGSYADDPQVDRVILFTANGRYGEARPGNVQIIAQSDLVDFASVRRGLLPAPIRHWFDMSIEGQAA